MVFTFFVFTFSIVWFCVWQAGNIAELLLKEGFARCVDWSMGVVTSGKEKLRAAERLVGRWGGESLNFELICRDWK